MHRAELRLVELDAFWLEYERHASNVRECDFLPLEAPQTTARESASSVRFDVCGLRSRTRLAVAA